MKKSIIFILSYVLLVLILPLLPLKSFTLVKNPFLWNVFVYVLLFTLGVVLFHQDLKSMLIEVKKKKIQVILLSFLAFFIILIATIGLNLIIKSWEVSQNQAAVNQLLKKSTFAMIIVVILGPFVEELAFRHILIGKFSANLPTWLTTLLSILCFGFIHMKLFSLKGFTQILSYFIVGIVLSILYVKRNKNIIYPLSAHVLNNLISVVLSVI